MATGRTHGASWGLTARIADVRSCRRAVVRAGPVDALPRLERDLMRYDTADRVGGHAWAGMVTAGRVCFLSVEPGGR